MAATTELPSKNALGEPDSHVATRHMRTVVKCLLIIALLATVGLLIFYRPAAYLAAIPVPILYFILAVLNLMERRSRASQLRRPGQTTLGQEEIEVDVETIGVVTVLKVLGVLAIGTFIIAAAFFDLAVVGVIAAGGFLLAILIELPYLPLFFTESERDERAKLTGESKPNAEQN
jgi:hypothetical protein